MWFYSLSKLYLLLLPGGSLWIASFLLTSATEEERTRSGSFVILRWTAKLLLFFGCLGVVVALLNPVGLLLLPIFILSLLSLLALSARSSRANFSQCLLAAMLNEIPLSMVSRTLANHAFWMNRRRFDRFASRIEQGEPVGEILRSIPMHIPSVLQIQLSSQGKRDPRILESLKKAAQVDEDYRTACREWIESSLYLVGLTLLLSIGLTFVFVRPLQFLPNMYAEFEITPNPILEWASYHRSQLIGASVVMILATFLLFAVFAFYYMEWVPQSWRFLFMGNERFERASALMSLGLLIQQGLTWQEALKEIERWHPLSSFRKAARKGVVEGATQANVGKTLHRLGWLPSTLIVDTDRALEQARLGTFLFQVALERATESRLKWLTLSRIIVPLGLALIGVVVGIFAWTTYDTLQRVTLFEP